MTALAARAITRFGWAWLLASLLCVTASARADDAERARDQLVYGQRVAMGTLLGSGALSVAAGSTLLAAQEGRFTNAFAVQQIAWGAVDAVIAGAGLWGLSREARRDEPLAFWQARRARIKRVFWINAGLDVLYVASGALLWSLSKDARLAGTGAGIVPQGGFLLCFDAIAAWSF